MEDYLYLDIPEFQVDYKPWKQYGYTKNKENLKHELSDASGGYCMYCYARVRVDQKWFGNLEHAIEKTNSKKLVECIPNIGLACAVCNQSFKRLGERKRKIPAFICGEFERNSRCTEKTLAQCTSPCKALRDLQRSYSAMPSAEIILQPMGISGIHSGKPLCLQYNVLDMEFSPNRKLHNYSQEDDLFIWKHIQRFRLNDPKYRTRALLDFVKNVIDSDGNIQKYEYNNLIVQLFADKLKEKTPKERVGICSKIYPVMFLKI